MANGCLFWIFFKVIKMLQNLMLVAIVQLYEYTLKYQSIFHINFIYPVLLNG